VLLVLVAVVLVVIVLSPHQWVILEYKIEVLVEVLVLEELLVQKEVAEVLAVPELSSSHILHKYSKNIQWA
jgi:hypothetical protein